jgi:hypothetical protein
VPDELTVGLKVQLDKLYADMDKAVAAVKARMQQMEESYKGAIRVSAKGIVEKVPGVAPGEKGISVTISGQINKQKELSKRLEESIRADEYIAARTARAGRASGKPELIKQAIIEQGKLLMDVGKAAPASTLRRIEANLLKYIMALDKMTEKLARTAEREAERQLTRRTKGLEYAEELAERHQRKQNKRTIDALKRQEDVAREQIKERTESVRRQQELFRRQFKTDPREALREQRQLERLVGDPNLQYSEITRRNVRRQREWMEDQIEKERQRTTNKDKQRMNKRNELLDQVNNIEEKATKRASAMGRRKMVTQEQLIRENEYFGDKQKTLEGKYRDLIAQGYSPARAVQEVTAYQQRIRDERKKGSDKFNQNIQDMGREYAAASEDDKKRLRKQRAYRQLPQVEADILAAEKKQTQVNALRDARLAKKERERQGSQQIMGLASAGIGLLGTPGFALLNIAFASMSGLKYAGIAAVATAVGEVVRGLNSMADSARQSAESLGLMTKEFKISKMEFEAVKALWGQAMEGAEKRRLDYLKTFLETPKGMEAGSLWANLRAEFSLSKLPAQIVERGGGVGGAMGKGLIPIYGLKGWTWDPLIRALKGYREDVDPRVREERLGNAIFEMRKQMLPFQSTIEKPEDMWRRMQVAFASVQDSQVMLQQRALEVAEKQLVELQKLNEPQKEREYQEAAFGFYMP